MACLAVNYNDRGKVTPIEVDIPAWQKKRIAKEGGRLPTPYKTHALIDTGAGACGVTPNIIAALSLMPTSPLPTTVMTANGNTTSFRYTCSFTFISEPAIKEMTFPVLGYNPSDPRFEFIVGMEFMEKCFIRYHPDEKFITLEYPPPAAFFSAK